MPPHFLAWKLYARNVRKFATKIALRQNSINWYRAYLLFWFAYLVSSALAWCICYMRWIIQNLGWCIWYFHNKNVRISVYILWINFAKSSPSCVLWGKKYAGLKKVHHCRLWRLWLIWAMPMSHTLCELYNFCLVSPGGGLVFFQIKILRCKAWLWPFGWAWSSGYILSSSSVHHGVQSLNI